MKKKFLQTFLFTVLLALIVSSSVSAQQQSAEGYDPEDGMYIKAEEEYYWEGRYSNDRVFSEYIANELAGDYENITNYAVGGAFSGDLSNDGEERSNWSEWLKGWGGVEQTERFLADVGGAADPEALYIVSIGGNDAYAVEDLGIENASELSSDYALEMVQNLVENGAKYILLPNHFMDDRTDAEEFSDIRNQLVVNKIEDYLAEGSTPNDVEVIYGENHQLRENIEKQGYEKFGYKSMGFYLVSDWVPAYGYGLAAEDNSDIFPTSEEEVSDSDYGIYSTDSDYYTPEATGWEPDDFYTYDEYHLSGRSNKHMATYLLNTDIDTDAGIFEQVYNGPESSFATAIADGTIPSEYSTVYTFGDSSIDIGRGLEVTTQLVENRDKENGETDDSSHTVKAGDNLWNIVEHHYSEYHTDAQILKGVHDVYNANHEKIYDPDLIYPDQHLSLPNIESSASK